MALGGNDFNAIRISLASRLSRSRSGLTVRSPSPRRSTTGRSAPRKDGLFCERIFGPTKDWECYCGKYKKIRYKGVICDRCGVEVARAKVRRERMGHIALAAPVAHIWFSKGTPSRLGSACWTCLPRNLDRVLYFAQYLVTSVDDEFQARCASTRAPGGARSRALRRIDVRRRSEDSPSSTEQLEALGEAPETVTTKKMTPTTTPGESWKPRSTRSRSR